MPLLLMGGCASYTEQTKDMRDQFFSASYKEALTSLEKSDINSKGSDRLLYVLERGMIYDRLGDAKKARADLLKGDKIADELYTTSITKTAATFVFNESAADYAGEDYEKVAIHTQLALSYIGDQDWAAARVEAKKINNKLAEINQQYDDSKNKYSEDAFARYVSGLIYELKGEIDDAIIDYRKALQLYQGSYRDFGGGIPDQLEGALYRLLTQRNRHDEAKKLTTKSPPFSGNEGEIAVIHEVGHIATKHAEEFALMISGQMVRFSFPAISRSASSVYGRTGIELANQSKLIAGEKFQDMNAIAKQCLEDRRGRLIAKGAARLLVKAQLTEEAYQRYGLLGGLAANIYGVVTETADTRSWTLLPEAYYVTRTRVPAGRHTVRIYSAGRLTKIETVDLKKGQLLLLRG